MHKVAKYYGLPPRDFTRATLEACQNHSWPGNLKELETFVKRYLIAGDVELPGSLEASERAQGLPLIGEHAEVAGGREWFFPAVAEVHDSECPVGNGKKRHRISP